MTKKVLTLIIVVAIGLVAVVTCPDKNAHEAAVMQKLNSAISETIKKNNDENTSTFEKGLMMLGSMFASKIAETAVSNSLNVNNYFVMSTGEVTFGDKTRTVSVGVFGHIFITFDSKDIAEAIEKL